MSAQHKKPVPAPKLSRRSSKALLWLKVCKARQAPAVHAYDAIVKVICTPSFGVTGFVHRLLSRAHRNWHLVPEAKQVQLLLQRVFVETLPIYGMICLLSKVVRTVLRVSMGPHPKP